MSTFIPRLFDVKPNSNVGVPSAFGAICGEVFGEGELTAFESLLFMSDDMVSSDVVSVEEASAEVALGDVDFSYLDGGIGVNDNILKGIELSELGGSDSKQDNALSLLSLNDVDFEVHDKEPSLTMSNAHMESEAEVQPDDMNHNEQSISPLSESAVEQQIEEGTKANSGESNNKNNEEEKFEEAIKSQEFTQNTTPILIRVENSNDEGARNQNFEGRAVGGIKALDSKEESSESSRGVGAEIEFKADTNDSEGSKSDLQDEGFKERNNTGKEVIAEKFASNEKEQQSEARGIESDIEIYIEDKSRPMKSYNEASRINKELDEVIPQKIIEQVSMKIGTLIRNEEKIISVNLEPAELGRIEISFSFDKNGMQSIDILSEKFTTLDMLESGSMELRAKLSEMGVESEASINFGLKNNGGSLYNENNGKNKERGGNDNDNDSSAIKSNGEIVINLTSQTNGYSNLNLLI